MARGLDGFFDTRVWRCAVLRDRERRSPPVSGGYGEGETPLPIPNRAVKPLSADGTWPARARESRSPPVYLSSKGGPSPTGRPALLRGGASQLSALRSPAERARGAD